MVSLAADELGMSKQSPGDAPGVEIPTRSQRVAARRTLLAFSARRQRPGSGSVLQELMKEGAPPKAWWGQAACLLQTQGIQVAVTGAVAANAYMPPRQTTDLDLALPIADLGKAGMALEADGWTFLGDLPRYEHLRSTAWRLCHNELDLIGLPGAWGRAAITTAQGNTVVAGLPTMTLPWVVAMKLISARPQDSADICRMLGPASEEQLRAVRGRSLRLEPEMLLK